MPPGRIIRRAAFLYGRFAVDKYLKARYNKSIRSLGNGVLRKCHIRRCNMLETVLTGIAAFVGTNIDDIFIDAIFYSEADTKQKRVCVLFGKYIGIGLLVLVSLLGAFVFQKIPTTYIGFLGLIPIALGIKEIILYRKDDDDEVEMRGKGFLSRVILITVVNGADNIGVYVPLFAPYTVWECLVCLAVFAVMILVWCFISQKLTSLPFLHRFLSENKKKIVPTVFIALGIYILIENFLF